MKVCIVCNLEHNRTGVTCSKECQVKLQNEKRKQSNLKKYGVENTFQSKELTTYSFTCPDCGKIYTSNAYNKKCDCYFIKLCVICNNKHTRRGVTCSKECQGIYQSNIWKNKPQEEKQQSIEKQQETWKNKTQEEINKIKEKQKELWKNKPQEEIDKMKEKLQKSWKNKTQKEIDKRTKKSKQTKLKRYGNENFVNLEKHAETWKNKPQEEIDKIYKRIKQTMLERYGVEYILQSQEIKDKVMQTNLKQYGVEYSSQSQEIKDKVMQTNLKKYGVPWYCMTKDCRKKSLQNNSKINQHFAKKLKETNIEFEQEFNISHNSFDFKINNTMIEINPSYTHNSTKGTHFPRSKPLDKNYHLNKSQLAVDNGFHCIHVFNWDNKEKIIQMFTPKQKLYARNCLLKEVNKNDTDYFLNQFHLQNTCKGQKYSYGLYFQDELIQIMTFGKPRYNKNYEFELLRLCTNSNYQIIGGSQKLFKHFLRELNPKSIVSYCDYSKFSGDVYKRLGMTLKNYGKPSCNWSKGIEKITNNLLNQRGFDQLFGTSFGKGTSNRDLMIEHGWVEVYDCGQSTYIWQ